MNQQHIYDSLIKNQTRSIENAKAVCLQKYGKSVMSNKTISIYNTTLNKLMCPAFWDTILCWPNTPSNTVAAIACPTYVAGFDKEMNNATRTCTENGTWFYHETHNDFWTNYTQCFGSQRATIVVKVNNTEQPSQLLKDYIPIIKTISRTGYSVSFVTLTVAFAIILFFKKLHCSRNKLHMHLFASFILRAFFFLFKDLMFVEGIGLSSDLRQENGSSIFVIDSETNNWTCKFVTSLWEYFITANYSWIFMEGVYLHNLIFRALFADSNHNIIIYIILGWGLPFLVVASWVVTRIIMEDTFCWTIHGNSWTFLIIRIPTIISICLNLFIFINISIVLFIKLRSPLNEETRRYRKWAKSTLVLVPLFGIHYAIFLIMWYSIKKGDVIEIVWLFGDQLFASFQGFLVAVLYCYLNGEVKTEIKPYMHMFLTYCATSSCLKYCFPSREKYLTSTRTRSSVCTTVSCSSLHNNGITHHYNQIRCTVFSGKHSHKLDVDEEHISQLSTRSWNYIPPKKKTRMKTKYEMTDLSQTNPLCFNSDKNLKVQETSLWIPQNKLHSQSDSHLLDEKINMNLENC